MRLVASLKSVPSLVAIAAAVSLFAGPAAAQDKPSGEITIWSWNIAASSLKATVAGFNKQYPDVKVTVEDLGNQPTYDKSIAGCAAGGDRPARHRLDRERRGRELLEPVPRLLRRPAYAGLHRRGPGEIPRLQAHRARGRRQGLCDAVGFRPGRHVLPPRLLREGRRRSGLDQDLGRFHRRRQEDPGRQSGRDHDQRRFQRRHRILPHDLQRAGLRLFRRPTGSRSRSTSRNASTP